MRISNLNRHSKPSELTARDESRWIVVAAVLLLITGQTHRVVSLLQLGRGSYRAALTHILENSPEGVVRIGSDHDFRNRMLVDFYAPSLAKSHTIHYIPQADWHHEPPDRLLTHSGEVSYQSPPDITVPGIRSLPFFRCTQIPPEFRAGTGFYTVKTADPTQLDPRIQDIFQELPQVLTIGHAQVILEIQSRSRVQSRSI